MLPHDDLENVSIGKKMLYYILTVETTILITCGTWFFSVYPTLVTKEELISLAPYARDKGRIMEKLAFHDDAVKDGILTLKKLNQKFTLEIRQLQIKVAKLEAVNGNGKSW